jgi:hypothetical protein
MSRPPTSEKAAQGYVGRFGIFAIICLAAALSSGCSVLNSDVGSPLSTKPAELKIGESHLSDVLREVGPPSKISATAGGFAMLYEYNGIVEKQLGFHFQVPVLALVKFVGAKSWLDHQAWLVTFDTNSVLQGWGEERWRTVLGKGGGAQLLVTVASLVDSTQIRRPAPQHEWGKSWLAPLPKVLNTQSSLDNGSLGLEQVQAPTAVGQRTLEMTPPPRKFPKKK